MQPNATLTARQERAVLALITQPNMDAAAEACGVNRTTLWRWMQAPAFRAAILAARREAVSVAGTTMAGACAEAVETLRAVCADPVAPASARVAAAREILERAAATVELEDLAARLDALEATRRSPDADQAANRAPGDTRRDGRAAV